MSTPAPNHLKSIDGLRGVAALMVVVFHLFNCSGFPELRLVHHLNLLRPLHDSWTGVNLFLILSGFCLYWPLARNPEREFRFGSFMQRRAWRIVPAYYASLLLVPVALMFLQPMGLGKELSVWPKGPLDFALHLVLLHPLTGESIRSWNSVTWSLGLEWTWYLFFPVAVWMFRKWGAVRAVAAMAVITTTYLVGAWLLVGPSSRFNEEQALAIRTFLPGRLWEFGLGMFVASWVARHGKVSRKNMMLMLAAIPVLLALGHAATPIDPMLPVRNLIYGVAFTFLMFLAIGSAENPVQRILETPWLQRVGEYSYSLYLFHVPAVLLITGVLKFAGLPSLACFVLSLLTLPLLIWLAKWQYAFFEQPFLHIREKRPQPAAASLPQLQPNIAP
jgi:peptidoglycan/LPS O-acetylase OafA/YrhL